MMENAFNRSSRNSEKNTNNPKVIMYSITKLGCTASAKENIALMIARSKISSSVISGLFSARIWHLFDCEMLMILSTSWTDFNKNLLSTKKEIFMKSLEHNSTGRYRRDKYNKDTNRCEYEDFLIVVVVS